MNKKHLSRRTLLKVGLSSTLLASIPISGLTLTFSDKEQEKLVGAVENMPYKPEKVGTLSAKEISNLKQFSEWVIVAWEFPDMDAYPDTLLDILTVKTNELPSYLEEYKSASRLIDGALARFTSNNEAYLHLLLSGREKESVIKTRLGRAQRFVFDEIVRHLVVSGGFKRFGLINYTGYVGGSFYAPKSYRRGAL